MRHPVAALLFAAAIASLPAVADSVAFVADVRGSATIEGNGQLAFLAGLKTGTRVLLGTHATAAITYAASGAEFALAGPGVFLVRADEVVAEKGSAPKRRAVAALTDAATASLRMRGLAPVSSPAVLEYPVSTRISTLRPQLRWRAAPGAEYTVAVQDAAGRELWKGAARGDGARPDVKLSAGQRYSWTLATARGPVGDAQFETLSMEALRRVEKSRGGSRTFGERVVHALLLQEVGAEQEARQAWSALARERPEMPELPALAR